MSQSVIRCLAQFPERNLIALIKDTAFFGSASTNPFNFHHYDMTNFVLYVNGFQHPAEPLTMDCSSPFGATRAYEIFFQVLVYIMMTFLS